VLFEGLEGFPAGTVQGRDHFRDLEIIASVCL